MKAFFAFLMAFTFTVAGHATDGGMIAGGGGNTLPFSPVGAETVDHLLLFAQRELYMQLSLDSWDPTFSWPQLFAGQPTILDLIAQNKIYSKGPCEDKFGNGRDGSMYSPVAHEICIDAPRLGQKLSASDARAQTLALVAHEYSHLKGFNEAQAQALQHYLVNVFANSSATQSTDILKLVSEKLYRIRVELTLLESKDSSALTWENLCNLSKNINEAMTAIQTGSLSSPYSFFDKNLHRTQNSYYVFQSAMMWQACMNSGADPAREKYQPYVRRWFSGRSSAPVQEVAKDVASDPTLLQDGDLRADISVPQANSPKSFVKLMAPFDNFIMSAITARANLIGQMTF